MMSSDANFESVSCNLSQPLRIFRYDTVVRRLIVIYVKDEKYDEEMQDSR